MKTPQSQLRVTQKTVKELIKQFTGQSNILTIPRIFVSMTGDHIAALLLSQVLYWRERCTPESRGWFYKSLTDWEDELGLSAFQTRRALKLLDQFGVITVKRRVRGAPTLHYSIDEGVFTGALISHLESRATASSENPKVKKLDNRETPRSESQEDAQSESRVTSRSEHAESEASFLSETTSEITSQTTAESTAAAALPPNKLRWTLEDTDDGTYQLKDVTESFRIATGHVGDDGSADLIRRDTFFSSLAVATILRTIKERRHSRINSLKYFIPVLLELNERCHQALRLSASAMVGAGLAERRAMELRRIRWTVDAWLAGDEAMSPEAVIRCREAGLRRQSDAPIHQREGNVQSS